MNREKFENVQIDIIEVLDVVTDASLPIDNWGTGANSNPN